MRDETLQPARAQIDITLASGRKKRVDIKEAGQTRRPNQRRTRTPADLPHSSGGRVMSAKEKRKRKWCVGKSDHLLPPPTPFP